MILSIQFYIHNYIFETEIEYDQKFVVCQEVHLGKRAYCGTWFPGTHSTS